ncbi:MAG TPA: FTR1 family protein, partial [Thermodesulfobacteriota bacterium]|nr:FTR1 family protein [Thermodesulfobacteriota bacterium]
MFESFVIMLREGIEAALVVGIVLVVLKRAGRRDLERPVFRGLGLAVLASIAAAIVLHFMPVGDEIYEGTLYWVSAAFVVSMMVWMHRKGKMLRSQVEGRVRQAMEGGSPGKTSREGWMLGAFVFLMVFREGAEAVMFLAAVHLTTDAILGFI